MKRTEAALFVNGKPVRGILEQFEATDQTFVTSGNADGTTSTLNFTNSTGGTFTVTNSNLLFNAGGGGVTSVTGTAPVVSSGGETPAISVTTAAVTNGSASLATGDQIYDFVAGFTAPAAGRIVVTEDEGTDATMYPTFVTAAGTVPLFNHGTFTYNPGDGLLTVPKVQVNGTLTVGVDDTGHDVKFFGATAGRYLLWDEVNDRLKFRDNVKAVFGHGNDLEIYHDATDNHIDVTSTLQIATGTSDVAVNIGHTTSETTVNDNLSVVGDFYVDKIRRKSDSDTTTKILLNDEVLKLYAGHSSDEVVNVSSGSVVVDGTLTATGFIGAKSVLRSQSFYVNANPFVHDALYFGHTTGNQPNNWNDAQPIGGDPMTVASFTLSDDDQKWGMIIPFDISKIEILCGCRPGGTHTDQFSLVLYTAPRTTAATSITLTRVAQSGVNFLSGGKFQNNDLTHTADIDAGTMIYVGIGTNTAVPVAKNAPGYMSITITQR